MPSNEAGISGNSNAKKIISLAVTLLIVTGVMGVILGIVHDITLEPIRITQERLKSDAMKAALPEADSFSRTALPEGADAIVSGVSEAIAANGALLGYCVTVTPKGYAGPIEMIVGITNAGHLRAVSILNQSETPGLGAKSALPAFYGQYENKDVKSFTVVKTEPGAPDQIQAISGATITTNGVTAGANTALSHWRSFLAPNASGVQDASSSPTIPAEEE